jgi:glycosyltransferase involved in cell wall biosynthesis
LRTTAFASHLPEYGWEVTVLAPRDGAYFRDPELRFPEEQVVRTPSLELSRLGKQMLRSGGDDVRPADVHGARAALRSLARTTLYYPDAQIGWYPPAVLSSRRALRGQRFDLIFSSSFPVTAHLIARRLHRRLQVPWIADFRDPWSQMLPEGSSPRGRALRLERSLASEASGLIMTSASWAALHSELWGRPVDMIPNGYDGLPRRARRGDSGAARSNRGFTLAYLGSYYPATQRLRAVWDAVASINGDRNGCVDRLLFIGDLHPSLERELAQRGLTPLVEATGFLPHREALARLSEATALVVAGPACATEILRGQVAAKLPEYLATGLPIIYVGDPDCDAADLLREHAACHVVTTDDVTGVASALNASRGGPVERNLCSLSRASLTGRLAQLFDRAVGRRLQHPQFS